MYAASECRSDTASLILKGMFPVDKPEASADSGEASSTDTSADAGGGE